MDRCVLLFGVLVVMVIHHADAAKHVNVGKMARRLKEQRNFRGTVEELEQMVGLGGKSKIKSVRTMKTAQGRWTERLQQFYGDLEVFGASLSADQRKSKGYTGTISGDVFTGLENEVPDSDACQQPRRDLKRLVFKAEGVRRSDVSKIDIKRNLHVTNDGKPVIAYHVTFLGVNRDNKPIRPTYVIDACKMTVLSKYNNIQNKGVMKRQAGHCHNDTTTTAPQTSPSTSATTSATTSLTTPTTSATTATSATTSLTTPTTSATTPPTSASPSPTTLTTSATTPTTSASPSPTTPTTSATTPTTSASPSPTTSTTSPTTPQPITSPTTEDYCESDTTSMTTSSLACTIAQGVGGNDKVGMWEYGSADFCLNTTVDGSTCILENEYVRVIDLKQQTSKANAATASYTCSSGYSDGINGAYSPVLDAMHFGTKSARMFLEWYDLDALTFKPVLYVHYGQNYENAFWDGSSLTFGDGRFTFYPLVNQDVISHELAHGFTEQNSGLVYRRQSGGMNEAFSDITGEATEVFARGYNDWKVGGEIFKAANGALRYFANPTLDGRSIMNVNAYYNGLGVHYSSGIYNHAFYQLVKVNSVPMKDAYGCFVRANILYWTSSSTFAAGACGVMRACYDLGFDFYAVKRSFQAVGITFGSCDEDSIFDTLSSSQEVTDIDVSSSVKPAYLLRPPSGTSSVQITTSGSGGNDITISIYDDLENESLLKTGVNDVTQSASAASPLYVRLSATSSTTITEVFMQVTFQ